MTNYVTMQRRIWNELDRTDITSDAKDAIQSAIKHYAGDRFWFNEERWEATSVAGTEYYPTPSNFRDIDSMKVTVNNNSYLLKYRRWRDLEEWAVSGDTYQGYPTDFAMHRNEFRLYPVPNDAYVLTLTGLRDLDALVNDTDGNAWMADGEEMIRSRACADLIYNVLQDYTEPRGTLYQAREIEAYKRLKRESYNRTVVGRSRKAIW